MENYEDVRLKYIDLDEHQYKKGWSYNLVLGEIYESYVEEDTLYLLYEFGTLPIKGQYALEDISRYFEIIK